MAPLWLVVALAWPHCVAAEIPNFQALARGDREVKKLAR
ncbi:hypothetical protein XCR_2286 [Xanthomonas campestris pv. raphani 756C]|nr:hypothetical protein XCR_2286 [Xanthomonas campestris pv. raphani 756C]